MSAALSDVPAIVVTSTDMSIQVESADDGRTAKLRSSVSFSFEPSPSGEPTAAASNAFPRLPRRSSLSSALHSASASASASPSTPAKQSLWCRLQAVISSGVLGHLSVDQRKLQESLYEVISSETTYHSSLLLLHRQFQEPLLPLPQRSSPPSQDSSQCIISETDYRDLFSNVDEVRQRSAAFLADLQRAYQADVLLSGLCEVIHTHATSYFYPYKQYCAHNITRDRTLQQLTEQNAAFAALLSRLEASPDCRYLTLTAFLHLPVQRVQRLPMLVAAILKRMEPGHRERDRCEQAFQALTTLVRHCDEDAARELQRLEAAACGDSNQVTLSKGRPSWRRRGMRRTWSESATSKKAN